MALTTQQLAALKADILATPELVAQPNNADGFDYIAKYYAVIASPDFWVWRTAVNRTEIYNATSPDNTTWDWTTYKGQSVTEQNAWTQMFMGDTADFSKANLRLGISKIFGAANAQTAHCLSMGRRLAKRVEKLFATGAGSTGVPATMGREGNISIADVEAARQS